MSFAARFRELNAISLLQYEDCFGIRLGCEGRLPPADIQRIASLLNEDFSLVQSVFFRLICKSDCVEYRSPDMKKRADEIQYCPRCVELGYHSYVHEMPWLAKCPFHLVTLKKTYALHMEQGTSRLKRVQAIRQLMVSNCRSWPRPSEADLHVAKFCKDSYLKLLICWIKQAKDSATRLSAGHIWDGGEYETEKSYGHSLGRLRRLEKMPKLIEPLFTTVGESWNLTVRHFPLEVKNELHRLSQYAPFWRIFSFYKSVGARSNHPPAFIAKLQVTQRLLTKRHGKCRCRWGKGLAGWSSRWVQTGPDGWPYWGLKCPYELAIDDLEPGWGYPDRLLSNRQAWAALLRFIELSDVMHEAGLIEYTADANITPYGHLCTYPQVWPCCEWKTTSPLTELLNAVAEFEVDTTVCKTLTWLSAIEQGDKPYDLDMPAACVRLCETDGGLSLIKWRPRNGSV
ncbi:hypothetical protein G5B35_12250 [Parapusillimonas sp. SGNA-6]|nr:hypothetical protein [Parapusillimonas sp. SGNA-6]